MDSTEEAQLPHKSVVEEGTDSTKCVLVSTLHHYISINPGPQYVRTQQSCSLRACSSAPDMTTTFRIIGAATCGRVYHHMTDFTKAYKREKDHHFLHATLQNDWKMHNRIYDDFQEYAMSASKSRSASNPRYILHVPRPIEYITKEDSNRQDAILLHLPPEEQQLGPVNTLITSHIPPLPAQLRHKLIQYFCDPDLQEKAHNDPSNRDCLIRPYLGKIKQSRIAPVSCWSARNLIVHLDQLDSLGLLHDGPNPGEEVEGSAVCALARSMAEALAIMHWSCGLDARDVEFVLGGRPHPDSTTTLSRCAETGDQGREVQLYLLDFNQVRPLPNVFDPSVPSVDEGVLQDLIFDLIKQATKHFFSNDEYYPRPGRGPPELWEAFEKQYLDTAERVLRVKLEHGVSDEYTKRIEIILDLPRKFLEDVVAKQKIRECDAEASRRRVEKVSALKDGK